MKYVEKSTITGAIIYKMLSNRMYEISISDFARVINSTSKKLVNEGFILVGDFKVAKLNEFKTFKIIRKDKKILICLPKSIEGVTIAAIKEVCDVFLTQRDGIAWKITTNFVSSTIKEI